MQRRAPRAVDDKVGPGGRPSQPHRQPQPLREVGAHEYARGRTPDEDCLAFPLGYADCAALELVDECLGHGCLNQSEHIHAAIVDELDYFNTTVWEGVTLDEARRDPEGKILNGRFVTSNKGDLRKPECRDRYVACETNTHDDVSFFAATPPLEAKRLLRSQWATE